jgi:hypothetical protein
MATNNMKIQEVYQNFDCIQACARALGFADA